MIKKLVQSLSRVPGLGWLRRLVSDAADEPARGEPSPAARATAERRRTAGAGTARPMAARSSAPHREASKPAASPSAVPARGAPRRQVAALVARPPAGAPEARDAEPAAEFRQPPPPDAPGRRRQVAPVTPAEQSLGLAAIGPGRAFAFWEVSTHALRRAREFLTERNGKAHGTAVVLRVHDVPRVEFDGSNARRSMDVTIAETIAGEEDPVAPSAQIIKGRRYLDLWVDDLDAPGPSRILCELGVRDAAGGFVAVAWSPLLDLPTAAEEPAVEEESAREPPVRAPVNGEPADPWRPRLAPRPTASSRQTSGRRPTGPEHPVLATASLSGSVREGATEIEPPEVARASIDLAASSRWPSPSPSSAEALRWRDRAQRRLGGVSSGLLPRRGRT